MLSKSTIKYIQSLQHKKFRDESNAFVAEGPKVITELLQAANFICKAIYATAGWIEENKNQPHLKDIAITEVQDFELEKIAAYTSPNKVIAVFGKRNYHENILLNNKITLMLDDIRDPGNMGTIIRTADWFGIENIICSPHTVDIYNPKVVQSTMASLGRINVVYSDLEIVLKKSTGIRILAATLNGTSLQRVGPVSACILIIGNESNGISEPVLLLANERVSIPKSGEAESLNAATATAILLYALKYS